MIHYITSDGIGQPWVGNELRVVMGGGVPVTLHAMRPPRATHFTSEWARRVNEGTRGIYPLPPLSFALSMLVAPLLFRGRWWRAALNALFGKRESPRARVACLAHFFVACHWARGLRRERVDLVHAQWAYSSASIGMYGAWLLGRPFSFTGHATDLFRDRVALRDKIRRAAFIACISEFHRTFFLSEGARPEQLRVVYCGIDTERMAPPTATPRNEVFTVLSSGRLVEKKGFEYLVDACGLLRDRGRRVRCVIAGDGPLERPLRARDAERGLTGVVEFTGKPLSQEAIPAFMHTGDAYALPCVWAADNDVDGLPQMLMEAMACGLPGVSTELVGIPDLVIEGRTGLLVKPRDAAGLADAIERLMDDPALCRRLVEGARAHILRVFDIRTSSNPLIELFRERLARGTPQSGVAPPALVGGPAT